MGIACPAERIATSRRHYPTAAAGLSIGRIPTPLVAAILPKSRTRAKLCGCSLDFPQYFPGREKKRNFCDTWTVSSAKSF
jgi:hypothetical protein